MGESNAAENKMPNSQKGTREQMVDAAEQLMARHGIDAVSLNEIVRTAGQRNASALQYHFGNKAGLVQAIFDKHTPAIEQRREKYLEKLSAKPTLVEIVRALVLPLVEELDNPDGGHNYLLFLGRMQHHSLGPQSSADSRPNEPLQRIAVLLRIHESKLPPLQAEFRATIVRDVLIHSLADYCLRLQNNPEYDHDHRPAFVASLTGSITAILSQSVDLP